jgi:hypothetical protein
VPRLDGETALPLQIIRPEEIEHSGVATTEELLRLVSANFGGTTAASSTAKSGISAQPGASLRGLGGARTGAAERPADRQPCLPRTLRRHGRSARNSARSDRARRGAQGWGLGALRKQCDPLEQLDPQMFWQIHRSTSVNVQEIDSIGRNATEHVAVRLKKRKETLRVSQRFFVPLSPDAIRRRLMLSCSDLGARRARRRHPARRSVPSILRCRRRKHRAAAA